MAFLAVVGLARDDLHLVRFPFHAPPVFDNGENVGLANERCWRYRENARNLHYSFPDTKLPNVTGALSRFVKDRRVK